MIKIYNKSYAINIVKILLQIKCYQYDKEDIINHDREATTTPDEQDVPNDVHAEEVAEVILVDVVWGSEIQVLRPLPA